MNNASKLVKNKISDALLQGKSSVECVIDGYLFAEDKLSINCFGISADSELRIAVFIKNSEFKEISIIGKNEGDSLMIFSVKFKSVRAKKIYTRSVALVETLDRQI